LARQLSLELWRGLPSVGGGELRRVLLSDVAHAARPILDITRTSDDREQPVNVWPFADRRRLCRFSWRGTVCCRRALRHFDGHANYLGRGAGAGQSAQLLDPRAAMRNRSLAQALSAGIDQANLMALARPVDAHKPFNFFRMFRTSLASLTSGPPQRASIPVLALEAQPPRGLPSRPTCRGAGPLQVLKTRGFVGYSR